MTFSCCHDQSREQSSFPFCWSFRWLEESSFLCGAKHSRYRLPVWRRQHRTGSTTLQISSASLQWVSWFKVNFRAQYAAVWAIKLKLMRSYAQVFEFNILITSTVLSFWLRLLIERTAHVFLLSVSQWYQRPGPICHSQGQTTPLPSLWPSLPWVTRAASHGGLSARGVSEMTT